MSPRRVSLNKFAFAADVVTGDMTGTELAKKHGISSSHAYDLMRGKRRPEIARLIARLERHMFVTTRAATRRRIALLQGKALHTLSEAMTQPHTSVGLGAAKEVLRRALDDGPAAGPPPALDLTGLSPETKQRLLEELGGPMDDEAGGDGYDPPNEAPDER